MITKEISMQEWAEMQLSHLEAYIAGPIDYADITKTAWTSFGDATHPFIVLKKDSYGDIFKLNHDKSSFIVARPCLVEATGVLHIENQTGGGIEDILVGTRLYENGKVENIGSQSYYSATIKADDGEQTLLFSSTHATTKANEYLNLQYYFSDDGNTDIDFSSSEVFDSQIAVSIALKVVGLPQFTERNEKIKWVIT